MADGGRADGGRGAVFARNIVAGPLHSAIASDAKAAESRRRGRAVLWATLLTSLAGAATAALAVAAARQLAPAGSAASPTGFASSDTRRSVEKPARRLDRAAALLAAAALSDSAIEHYRGSFHNKFMYVPLAVSTLTLAASLRDAAGARFERRWSRAIVSRAVVSRAVVNAAAVATGIAGTGFHLYNVGKRPGGFGWLNLFYAAPLGAPAALSLAGLIGAAAHRLRSDASVPSGRLIAGLAAAGLFGTTGEAALLHFRGAYHNPAMFIPVTLPPVAASLLARAAWSGRSADAARRWLRLLTAVGFLGSAFHAYGIQRNMGGWRNWSQNLLNGPPLPAPPAFTALAIAGLAALDLIEGPSS